MEMIMDYKKRKVSFFTVCMNRLSFLQQTLPKNIKDNLDYGNVEFVVLNYNSTDGMDRWMKENMSEYIEQGIVKYLKTSEFKYFLRSHSRNVAAKEASGEILCSVDADNFIGKGFAEFINQSFSKNDNIYMAVDETKTTKDCFGRVCFRKDDFVKLTGYDESMKGYGFEDFDLRNRLQLLGREEALIVNKEFLNAISHTDNERIMNEYNTSEIERVFIKHLTPSSSDVVYCLVNKEVFIGTIVENRSFNATSIDNLFFKNRTSEYEYRLLEDEWKQGKSVSSTEIELSHDLSIIQTSTGSAYIEVVEDLHFSSLVMFFSQISNRIKMKENLKMKKVTVNDSQYGNATFDR